MAESEKNENGSFHFFFLSKMAELVKFNHKYSIFSNQVHVILLEKF